MSNGVMTPKLKCLLIAGALALTGGCDSPTRSHVAAGKDASPVVFESRTVSFPPAKLAKDEFIQGVTFSIKSCRIVAIGHIPRDWDFALHCETGNSLTLKCNPGHFASGLSSFKELDGFITIQFVSGAKAIEETGPFQIQATVTAEKTIPAGGGRRTLSFSPVRLNLEAGQSQLTDCEICPEAIVQPGRGLWHYYRPAMVCGPV